MVVEMFARMQSCCFRRRLRYVLLGILCLCILKFLSVRGFNSFGIPEEWHHETRTLADASLERIASLVSQQHDDFNATLDALLIERVPGTAGNRQVREYIETSMKKLGWHVEEDAFTGETPHGTKPFVNIVATLDPGACRRLVLACHYDSKYFSEGVFLGATDSAVPCAMMIQLARSLNKALQEHKSSDKSKELTLQLLFFDGEEAFEKWTSSDSLYGSRHLAEKWNKTPYSQKQCGTKTNLLSELDRIDVLVLLDLLGTSDPKFKSYFPETLALHERLVAIEERLQGLNLLESQTSHNGKAKYFHNRSSFSMVEDDHVPFMRKGVPILHVIPVPFPSVWHRLSDNRENLHHPTINNLNKIFQIFVAEYLHLNIDA